MSKSRIEALLATPKVAAAVEGFAANVETAVAEVIRVQQIPAPTFEEEQRAHYIAQRFEVLGLEDVSLDGLFNVYGRFPGSDPANHPPVIVSAHSDTVFARDTDLTVTRKGSHYVGPGISDNSAGVAGLFLLTAALQAQQFVSPADIWIVSNVGEEGLGDLRGMRAVVERFGKEAIYLVLEGGLFGQISHQAIGVQRFKVTVKAPGGHSWASFGRASAIHELGELIAAFTRLRVPTSPKTTYNVGVIEGGTSINTIAQTASLWLDLRSEVPTALTRLVNQVRQIVAERRREHSRLDTKVTIEMTQVGDRPAGSLPRTNYLVQWAEQALRLMGCTQVNYIAGSTDANIPLSQGITAVCIGLTKAGNAHRLDEYMNPAFLPKGLGQLLLLTLAAAGYEDKEG